MKLVTKLTSAAVLAASMIGGAHATGDNQTVTANVSYAAACQIDSAPTVINFDNAVVGVQQSIDFQIDVSCNFKNQNDRINLQILSPVGPTNQNVAYFMTGAPLNASTLLANTAHSVQPRSGGGDLNVVEHTFNVTAYLVRGANDFTPTDAPLTFSTNADIQISVTEIP